MRPRHLYDLLRLYHLRAVGNHRSRPQARTSFTTEVTGEMARVPMGAVVTQGVHQEEVLQEETRQEGQEDTLSGTRRTQAQGPHIRGLRRVAAEAVAEMAMVAAVVVAAGERQVARRPA